MDRRFFPKMVSWIYRRSLHKCAVSCTRENNLTIRPGAQLRGVKITITGRDNSLEIDEDVVIRASEIVIEGEKTHVRIGAHSELENVLIAAGGGEPILIGAHCKIGTGSVIKNFSGAPRSTAKPIFIPRDTVIGENAQIFKGTLIELGVTIPSEAIVAGNIPGPRLSSLAPIRIRPVQPAVHSHTGIGLLGQAFPSREDVSTFLPRAGKTISSENM